MSDGVAYVGGFVAMIVAAVLCGRFVESLAVAIVAALVLGICVLGLSVQVAGDDVEE